MVAWADLAAEDEYYDEWANLRTRPNVAVLMGYETAVRRQESLVDGFREGGAAYLFSAMSESEFLDYIDYLIFLAAQRDDPQELLPLLEQVLAEGGSEWRVGTRDGFASLEKRVPEGVAAAAREAIASSGTAGLLLAEAWHAAFGKAPDEEEAYEKAIKAVEQAGAHIVAPNNRRSTLGTMVRDMTSQGDWKLDLPTSSSDVPVKMAEALWVGQESRHGGNGYRKPSPEEAQAAVMLAVPLVQWFSSGALKRRP